MTITEQDIERARAWKEWDQSDASEITLAEYADHVTAELRQQLTEKDSKIAKLERVICGETSLIAVIADIREKSGLGAKPMLSDLAQEIGTKLAEKDAEIARLRKILKAIMDDADDCGSINHETIMEIVNG